MVSGSKIESADFCLPSWGYRILFKNEFLLCHFRFKPKISSRKLFPSDSSKIRPKIIPAKNGSEITIATQNDKKLQSVEEKSLLMQYHSIKIEKLPKRIKNKVRRNTSYANTAVDSVVNATWNRSSRITVNKVTLNALYKVSILWTKNVFPETRCISLWCLIRHCDCFQKRWTFEK